MSTHQEQLYIQSLKGLISEERLKILVDITGSYENAIEIHQQSLKLSASLFSVIATVEIALRNSIRRNLDQHFGSANWLCEFPPTFAWENYEHRKIASAINKAKGDKYNKMSPKEKRGLDNKAFPSGRSPNFTNEQVWKQRCQHIPISTGNIISLLTFNFWKTLYGDSYEHILWHVALKRTFPNGPVNRDRIVKNLEIIHTTRNRLAHHEPILGKRFGDTMNAIHFVCRNLGSDIPESAGTISTLLVDNMREVRKQQRVYRKLLKSHRK